MSGRPYNVEKLLERLEQLKSENKPLRPYKPLPQPPLTERRQRDPFTPAEILFEIQMQLRGVIEIDLAMRTVDPFRHERHIVGEPTKIVGLEAGEIMKLRRDLQAWLIWWRTQLALLRRDKAVMKRMEIRNGQESGS